MCGIAGSTKADSGVLGAMLARLAHRGPDGQGVWVDPQRPFGLAHARLAVIDLSPGGAQPMQSACGRWVLAFNGEIYNYRELRAGLEAEGAAFASDSDTEVLLALLIRHGEAALSRLVGMFAFAFLDRSSGSLLLVRDRLGIKPLVYAPLAGGDIAFASEIGALKAHPGVGTGLDHTALDLYLACLYVPAPLSIHQGIRKLPPGHLLRWRDGVTEVAEWWRPAYGGGRAPNVDEAVEELTPLVRRVVSDLMVSDVPLGCFLSGGVDSSVIAAIMAETARQAGADPIRTFTMTFDVAAYDERQAAAEVAGRIGSRHTELPAGSGLAALLPDMVRHFGEPFGNPTALLIHDLSRKAREHVTVALVGDGGDEVFAGYPRYQGGLLAGRYRRLVPGWLRRGVVAPLADLIPESSGGRHSLRRAREFLTGANLPADAMYASWVEYFSPEERRRLLGLDAAPSRPIAELYRQSPSADPLDCMQQTDLLSFLPGNLLSYGDAMSMRHALELRLPLIDHRLVEAVAAIDPAVRFAQGKKTLLRGVARRLLPAHMVDRPKRGFNPPMGLWLKNDLRDMVAERLTTRRMAALGLDGAVVAGLVEEQRRGLRDNSLKIWSLLVLDAWADQQEAA
ncbi:asparagine synthase (glutamine-hydrolyzing) [Magnetospirillum sp. ME-1]|uniref:asparagine synthase (glutamine-hydrolyzing) n=1 Tax=Magnetospirillum sp. ME-1 TaxID=1639348 RepID=UPI000A17F3AF|nr:asparagine synthase (glutamine-hydrolyzing) [Magnetospirillum sp. ME-1]ARJ66559.1 asparagine synthase (glutamine-hydrolyzing) [Magnetospirillum sp. ME-1]